jgi:hypothetical protein
MKTDSVLNDKIKKGFNLGGVPALGYDSDLGFQYGIVANLYHYGDGSNYPRYDHSLFFNWVQSTGGNTEYQLTYDSEHLIPKTRVNIDAMLMKDELQEFYGFNGYQASYNRAFEEKGNPAFISQVYYRCKREYTRFRFNLQGNITDRKWRWSGSCTWFDVCQGSVDINHLNKKRKGDNLLPDTTLLIDNLISWGIIKPNEKSGGKATLFEAGVIFDTRDNEPNPMKGLWSEAMIVASPAFLGSSSGFSKLILTHRQYFTLAPRVLNLAYRISYQTKLSGNIPYYLLPFMYSSMVVREGLGGAKSLRGISRNRVIGNGVLMGNFEVRWKFLQQYRFRQNFYCAVAGFTDVGKVTDKYKIMPTTSKGENYLTQGTSETWHQSVGLGFYVAMNQNFVVAFNYGKPLNKKDGDNGFYINLDFMF